MLKVMAFLTKREDLRTAEFIEYYERTHVPLIRELAPTPPGYRRSYLVRDDELSQEGDPVDFDVVTELVFPDRAAYLAWGAALAEAGDRVARDEERFLDRARTRAYVVREWVSSEPAGRAGSGAGSQR